MEEQDSFPVHILVLVGNTNVSTSVARSVWVYSYLDEGVVVFVESGPVAHLLQPIVDARCIEELVAEGPGAEEAMRKVLELLQVNSSCVPEALSVTKRQTLQQLQPSQRSVQAPSQADAPLLVRV
jgi:hypothetical protein